MWCNYGYLCISHNDHELANQAFNKAQIIEPENAWAWLGQALVAYRDNDVKEALSLFEQASTLSAGNLVCFSCNTFEESWCLTVYRSIRTASERIGLCSFAIRSFGHERDNARELFAARAVFRAIAILRG